MTSSSSRRLGAHHAAVRSRPRHRRRGARRAGGDQRRARRPAGQPAQQPDLPQGQPGRRADPDPGADLRHADARARSTTPPRPCCSRSSRQVDGRRRGRGRRQLAAGGARRAQSAARCSSTASGWRTCARRSPSANAHSPKGAIEDGDRHYQIYANDQAQHGRPIPHAGRRLPQRRAGAPLRRRPRSSIRSRTSATPGLANGKPSVLVILYRQPGANIIDTVDRVKALLPELQASISPAHRHHRRRSTASTTIRASLHDVERTLMISVVPGDHGGVRCSCATARATLIPSVAVPVSLIGTFGVDVSAAATASTICR